jgi:class 3 adenylate cyclase
MASSAAPMTDELRDVRALLDKARSLLDLNAQVDELIEESLQARRSLEDTMRVVLPALVEFVGAKGAFLRSFSEDLTMHTFVYPPELHIPEHEQVFATTGAETNGHATIESHQTIVIAQPLDVAGEWFGQAGIVLASDSAAAGDLLHVGASLNIMCEEVDNFLYAIRAARERHRVMMALGDALRHRVLGEGLQAAVRVLVQSVPIGKLLITCFAEEQSATTVHVQMYRGAELEFDTMGALDHGADELAVRALAQAYLRTGDKSILTRFGLERAQEEVLINGVTTTTVVGKVVVTSAVGGFNTYDRELLAGFAGFIRQRVVDFNKEWRTLARSFRAQDVGRLLNEADYVRRHLSPREEQVGIVFTDIAGFTKISEQILKSPSAVADLVERWSRQAVDIVWKHGGVFDKMVGDCVIALFGPPFFDTSPQDRLLRAVRCAKEIRAMTKALPSRPGFEQLRDSGLAVSTGVHLAPLFVGQFGPNDNYTGFSSGMNNTARLQGCAGRDEILVMRESIAKLADCDEFRFGAERDAKVKNVADPLVFAPLLDD